MASFSGSRAQAELPDVDDRLVEPETPYEILDGELVHVSPADEPHGTLHVQLAALVEAHTGLEFEVACDMLTRTSRIDDIAPDISVFPAARHPDTGRRQLEHLAFEIVSTQSMSYAGRKAAKLRARGVRRVFAIDVERSRVLEWSASLDRWSEITVPCIEDPTLDVPLPVDVLVTAVKADDAVARALLAKHNPVLQANLSAHLAEGFAEGFAEGRLAGKRDDVIALLGARGVTLDGATRARILAERDPAQLERWIARAATCATAAALFAERDPGQAHANPGRRPRCVIAQGATASRAQQGGRDEGTDAVDAGGCSGEKESPCIGTPLSRRLPRS
jgi:Uma2 family endonuclease